MVELGQGTTDNDFGVVANSFFDDKNLERKTYLVGDEPKRLLQAMMMEYVGSNPDMPYYHYVGVLASFKLSINMSIGGRTMTNAVSVHKAIMQHKGKKERKNDSE